MIDWSKEPTGSERVKATQAFWESYSRDFELFAKAVDAYRTARGAKEGEPDFLTSEAMLEFVNEHQRDWPIAATKVLLYLSQPPTGMPW